MAGLRVDVGAVGELGLDVERLGARLAMATNKPLNACLDSALRSTSRPTWLPRAIRIGAGSQDGAQNVRDVIRRPISRVS